MRDFKNILVTGGAGFIGVNFVRYVFEKTDFQGRIINLDKLTYAGNILSLKDIEAKFGGNRYFFEQADIADKNAITNVFEKYEIDCVVHFAAESHVDRSIVAPDDFINTNIIGTFTLLEVAKKFWKDKNNVLFHHISTDEVFGSLGDTGYFYEDTAYDPKSPYSASKAASDHLVMAYYNTYSIPITLSNCSNNYGPYQFPEKLIPLMILNIIEEKPLPIYGDGKNVRDWLYVEDHTSGIWKIIQNGKIGDKYNIGGENEIPNITVVDTLCEKIAKANGKDKDYYKQLKKFVKDRPGHDRRYAINCNKIKNELGWKQSVNFAEGIEKTINWYMDNSDWIENIRSGDYQKWIKKNYEERK